MIVTVTPNPSIDRTIRVERLVRSSLNRASVASSEAAGKGLNVSRDAGLEPTWRQGAGLAQVVDAVTTPAWVTPSKISLGEGSGGSG